MRPDVRFNAMPWYRRVWSLVTGWGWGLLWDVGTMARRFHNSQDDR